MLALFINKANRNCAEEEERLCIVIMSHKSIKEAGKI